MKKMMIVLLAMMTIAVQASAMSYSKARSQALYLTDKMGYELNLNDDQYDAVYEINLDYMMSVSVQADLFGVYWQRRNNELQYVLSAYQYQRFIQTEYFYRPVGWARNAFSFLVYNHYPNNRFFRNAPRVYDTYRGGNRQYQHSPYEGRTYTTEPNRNPAQPGATPPQPGKSKGQAVRGGRQQQQNNSTWRITSGNSGNNNRQGSPQGTFGSGRR